MLKEVKQQGDPAFANMLDKVKLGIVDEEVTEVLNSRVIGTEDDIDLSHGCIIVASIFAPKRK